MGQSRRISSRKQTPPKKNRKNSGGGRRHRPYGTWPIVLCSRNDDFKTPVLKNSRVFINRYCRPGPGPGQGPRARGQAKSKKILQAKGHGQANGPRALAKARPMGPGPSARPMGQGPGQARASPTVWGRQHGPWPSTNEHAVQPIRKIIISS